MATVSSLEITEIRGFGIGGYSLVSVIKAYMGVEIHCKSNLSSALPNDLPASRPDYSTPKEMTCLNYRQLGVVPGPTYTFCRKENSLALSENRSTIHQAPSP